MERLKWESIENEMRFCELNFYQILEIWQKYHLLAILNVCFKNLLADHAQSH